LHRKSLTENKIMNTEITDWFDKYLAPQEELTDRQIRYAPFRETYTTEEIREAHALWMAQEIKITIGERAGELEIRSKLREDNNREVYPADMSGMDDFLLLTCGDSEGDLAQSGDCMEFDGEVFLFDELDSTPYCIDVEGDCQYQNDCRILTEEFEGCWILESESEEFNGRVWRVGHRPDGIVMLPSGGYADRDDCSYCENCGEYYLDENPCCDDDDDGNIRDYNSGLYYNFYGEHDAYQIGFEVEKNSIGGMDSRGEWVGERPLFAGVETDGSCGVEAISHVYSLTDAGQKWFEDHVEKSSDWLDEDCDSRCGGHVNLSGKKVNLDNIRRLSGLVYALYRFRLNNSYACENKNLKNDGVKYSAIRMKKSNLAEFRLVSRVQSAHQIVWRFKFFRLFAECLEGEKSFRYLLEKSRPLMREAYSCPHKRAEIRQLAKHFNTYLNQGIIHSSIQKFI
jgi:hypothetical protein